MKLELLEGIMTEVRSLSIAIGLGIIKVQKSYSATTLATQSRE